MFPSHDQSALQAEIAQLRSDLLKAQMDNIRSTVGESQDDQSNVALDVLERELESASDNLIETSNNLANNTQTSTNQPASSGGGSGGTSTGGGSSAGGSTGGGGGGY